MTAPLDAPGLRVQRLLPEEWPVHAAAAAALGGLAYGCAEGAMPVAAAATSAAAPHAPEAVAARNLGSGGPRIDAWYGSTAPLAKGRCGDVRWQHDGRWLFGAIDLGEAHEEQTLAELTARAYRDIFATLRHTGCAHLLRVWNYLPGINADGGGLERYRQFNAARQQAFLDAGERAFEGAPAACALGTRQGPFSVRFLAGTRAPLALENPRQVPAYRYPGAYGPRSPSFSRAALLDAGGGRSALLVSGTASIVGHASRHPGDVQAQTRETLTNLQAVLDTANARGTARFTLQALDCTVYVRRAEDAACVRAVIEAALGADAPAARSAVYLEADICRTDLLVEIEAHAFAVGVPHGDDAGQAGMTQAGREQAAMPRGAQVPHKVPA
jgi:enamine deaminase RidA (YjgF/YER057c/UK114 family)